LHQFVPIRENLEEVEYCFLNFSCKALAFTANLQQQIFINTGHNANKSYMENVDQMRKGTKGDVKRMFVSI